MKDNYEEIFNEIKAGTPYKLMLNDGSYFEFEKQGINRYKMVLRDKSGTKREKKIIKESGLIELFDKFSNKATHINKIVH